MERDARKIYAASLFHISTHTLTWSVTSYLSLAYDNIDISTHTLTWSVTELKYFNVSFYKNFNSHAHVERDLTVRVLSISFDNFNSHAHVERDEIVRNWINAQSISTHTLTWSVTNSFQWDYIPMIISTHTLTWSVTSH